VRLLYKQHRFYWLIDSFSIPNLLVIFDDVPIKRLNELEFQKIQVNIGSSKPIVVSYLMYLNRGSFGVPVNASSFILGCHIMTPFILCASLKSLSEKLIAAWFTN